MIKGCALRRECICERTVPCSTCWERIVRRIEGSSTEKGTGKTWKVLFAIFDPCVDRFLPLIRSEETRRRPPFSKHFRKRDKKNRERRKRILIYKEVIRINHNRIDTQQPMKRKIKLI